MNCWAVANCLIHSLVSTVLKFIMSNNCLCLLFCKATILSHSLPPPVPPHTTTPSEKKNPASPPSPLPSLSAAVLSYQLFIAVKTASKQQQQQNAVTHCCTNSRCRHSHFQQTRHAWGGAAGELWLLATSLRDWQWSLHAWTRAHHIHGCILPIS